MLLTAGRNVKTSDMHLLEVVSMAPSSDMKSYAIVADWNPSFPHFSLINSETAKGLQLLVKLCLLLKS